MTDKIVVLTTCDSEELAGQIAAALVEKRLAACVQVLPGATSVYRWKGSVERAAEVLVLIKTRRSLLAEVEATVSRLHSYEVPELIALPVVDGAANYLSWMDKELKTHDEPEPHAL